MKYQKSSRSQKSSSNFGECGEMLRARVKVSVRVRARARVRARVRVRVGVGVLDLG